jgi:hypothetical protein
VVIWLELQPIMLMRYRDSTRIQPDLPGKNQIPAWFSFSEFFAIHFDFINFMAIVMDSNIKNTASSQAIFEDLQKSLLNKKQNRLTNIRRKQTNTRERRSSNIQSSASSIQSMSSLLAMLDTGNELSPKLRRQSSAKSNTSDSYLFQYLHL